MDLAYIRLLVYHLGDRGVLFERGLGDEEIVQIEDRFTIRFPPDLRKLLQHALPISDGFPNWRKGPAAALRRALNAPADDICFDIQHGNFWLPAWGERPRTLADALAMARVRIGEAPALIPIYAHRYIPADPHLPGNPIYAVVQTDITYSGCDLASFFTTAFEVPCPAWAATSPRPIRFWDELIA